MELLTESIELKSIEKNVYIEGYASSSVKDLEGETITEEALKLAARELTCSNWQNLQDVKREQRESFGLLGDLI